MAAAVARSPLELASEKSPVVAEGAALLLAHPANKPAAIAAIRIGTMDGLVRTTAT